MRISVQTSGRTGRRAAEGNLVFPCGSRWGPKVGLRFPAPPITPLASKCLAAFRNLGKCRRTEFPDLSVKKQPFIVWPLWVNPPPHHVEHL